MEKQVHLGNNIKSIRELKHMKQETLADALGPDWTQKKVSQLEAKESIDDAMLEEVAKALDVPVEAIKTYSEERVINIFKNEFKDHAVLNGNYNLFPTFNPLDKMVELYEALLKSEREKIALLERLLEKK